MDNIISRNSYISLKVTEAHFMARTAFKEEAEIQKLFWISHLKFFKGLRKTKNSFVIIAEKMGRNCPNLVQKLPEMVDNDGK